MNPSLLHSLRVAYENWLDESRLITLLEMLEKYDTGIESISLFSSSVHTPLTISETKYRTAILGERIALVKQYGLSCGVNILATIGHHHEDLNNTPAWQYQTMINADGIQSRGTVCMNDEQYIKEYIQSVYTMYAKIRPDHIWIDDDIRYGHLPIGNGCFCPLCVDKFNHNYGHSFTRESLRDALEEDNIPLRLAWLQFRSETISNLLSVIGKTVRAVDNKILLGFMSGERYAEGYDFAGYANALSEHGKYSIQWRPGGGAYTDRAFDDILQKSEQIGRQNAYLPSYVIHRQAEIENFPYNLIKKTPLSTAAEAFLGIMSGCTGAAFNILPSETGESICNAENHLKAIEQYKCISEILVSQTSNCSPAGIHTSWKTTDQAALPQGAFDKGYGGSYAEYCRDIFSIGLPECWKTEEAMVHTLTGRSVAVMTDSEIYRILSSGVYMDVHALRDLTARGFGAYLGFSAGQEIPIDAREQYTRDVINEGIYGGLRNGRQAFNSGDSFAIIKESMHSRVLSTLVDYHMKTLADCTTGLFENELGGRVCVCGYYPYSWIGDFQKAVQLRRIFRWLSYDRLPAYVESYHMLRLSAWQREEQLHCIAVFNPTNDIAENIYIRIAGVHNRAMLYGMHDLVMSLPCQPTQDQRDSMLCIPTIAPFTGIVITL